MSDARVNLLPGEVEDRNRRRRMLLMAGAAGLVLAVLLGAGWVYQMGRIDDAEARLAAQQQELQRLQAERARLQEFQALEQRREAADEVIAAALDGEVSFAGVLQDLAAVMPSDAQLDSLDVTLTPEAESGLGDRPAVLGRLTLTGKSLDSHAPGLERLLLELEKVASLSDLFFSTSTIEEDAAGDVVGFTVEADLGPEARTRRYGGGLPEDGQ